MGNVRCNSFLKLLKRMKGDEMVFFRRMTDRFLRFPPIPMFSIFLFGSTLLLYPNLGDGETIQGHEWKMHDIDNPNQTLPNGLD